MKIIVLRSVLKDALTLVERVAGDSSHLPILRNARITAADDHLAIVSTNLDIAVSTRIAAKVIQEGSVTVPVSVFLQLISNIPSERLDIEQKGSLIEIITDSYQGTIPTAPVDEFPIIPTIKDRSAELIIPGAVISQAFSSVIVATPTSESRPELQSVLFDFSLDSLLCAATDTFRLCQYIIESSQFTNSFPEGFRVLLPFKTVAEIIRITHPDDSVSIFFDGTQILFATKAYECVSRIVQGNFPEYQQIVPRSFSAEILVSPGELSRSIKLVSVAGGKNQEVMIRLSEKNSIEIFSSSSASGEHHAIIPVHVSGKLEQAVTFQVRYLLDGLRIFEGDRIFFGIGDEQKPASISLHKDSASFYIVMPTVKS